jgi:hypothetical protein
LRQRIALESDGERVEARIAYGRALAAAEVNPDLIPYIRRRLVVLDN